MKKKWFSFFFSRFSIFFKNRKWPHKQRARPSTTPRRAMACLQVGPARSTQTQVRLLAPAMLPLARPWWIPWSGCVRVCDESVTFSDWPGLTYYFNMTTVRLRKGDTQTESVMPQSLHTTLPAIRAAFCLSKSTPRATYTLSRETRPTSPRFPPAESACTPCC